ncbi:DedA family protein [Streptomyces sp. NRRL F-5053]|uniref:DedA family protein n=1 Tax=Streptomyces sp. NRRL F-5053 TaxID=1463854 RepID=UPI00099C08E5|nr:DedA family protein [Streptomyces sp. NRRL F-5053]
MSEPELLRGLALLPHIPWPDARSVTGSSWLWAVVALVAALDAVLPFMPSDMTVVTVAVFTGFDPGRLAPLMAVAAVGALGGDLLGYVLGRRFGPAALRRLLRGDRARRRHAWARELVERHALWLVLVSRCLPGARAACVLSLGGLRFPFRRFVVLDACAAAVWAVFLGLVGAAGGTGFRDDPLLAVLSAMGLSLLLAESARRLRGAVRARRGRVAGCARPGQDAVRARPGWATVRARPAPEQAGRTDGHRHPVGPGGGSGDRCLDAGPGGGEGDRCASGSGR